MAGGLHAAPLPGHDIKPPPEPEVTEHVAQSKRCPCCGEVTEGPLPLGVRARASFGPEAHAQAENLTCGNYVPSGRAAELMAETAGVRVPLGWIAGVRAKAAALVESSRFMDLVAGLLRQAEAVHADETLMSLPSTICACVESLTVSRSM